MIESKHKYAQLLSKALHFFERDLAANQRGVMSDYQLGRLRSRVWTAAALTIPFIILGAVVAVMQYQSMSRFGAQPSAIFGTTALVLVVIWGIAGGLFWLFTGGVLRDLREQRVAQVSGRVSLDMSRYTFLTRLPQTYSIMIEGKRFEITREALLTFKNGDPYTIYYAPHSKTVLSADWLRDDPFE